MMRFVFIFIAISFLFSCNFNSKNSLDISSKKVVVMLDGESIHEGDIFRRILAAYGNIDRDKINHEKWQIIYESALETEIIDRLLLRNAISEGIKVSDERIENLFSETLNTMGEKKFRKMLNERKATENDYKRFLRDREMISLYKEKLFQTITIDEKNAREYYEGHKEDFVSPEMVRLEVFVVKDKDDAEKIYHRWNNGESFEVLDKEFSIENRDAGRRLRPMPYDAIPAAFRTQIKEARVNEILSPLNIDGQYYIIRVVEKSESRVFAYSDVKDEIMNILRRKKENQVLFEWFERQKNGIKIEYLRNN